MGARTKLNATALDGALAIAILVTCCCGNILTGALVGGFIFKTQIVSGDDHSNHRR